MVVSLFLSQINGFPNCKRTNFSAKQNLERDISFIKNPMKERDSTIELMQKDAIGQISTSKALMRMLEIILEKWLDNERLKCRQSNATIKNIKDHYSKGLQMEKAKLKHEWKNYNQKS